MVQVISDKKAIDAAAAGGKLVVIDFFAEWCGPCKMVAPKYAELAEKQTDVAFFKVDVDKSRELAAEFSINAMPTFVAYKNGKAVGKVEGASIAEVEKMIAANKSAKPGHRLGGADQKKPQQYFAGGGNSSGQAILGPPGEGGEGGSKDDLVKGIFDKAREMGAQDITNARDNDISFQGSGRRLGFTPGPSPVMQAVKKRVVKIRVSFYANGFVVNDETQLRDPKTPEGQRFLAFLDKGLIPPEIAAEHKDCEIDVELADRSQEDYVPPKYVAYSGEGRTLAAASSTSASEVPPSATPAPKEFHFNEGEESCKVVLVLPDGSRQEIMVNYKRHTVNDLRGLALASVPRLGNFDLFARDFPKQRHLTDITQTIEEAKLKNGIVMVNKK